MRDGNLIKANEVLIGNRGGDHISIRVRPEPNSEGWFGAVVEIRCDGWHSLLGANFYRDELKRFAEEIRILYRDLSGTALLQPIEPFITLKFEGDGKGHVVVDGVARKSLSVATKLAFQFEIDQTYLPQIADGLSPSA
jgi:hypothetical protein